MAAKAPADMKSINPSSRIAKKEVIVTRHKSAQLKRQLRSGDRSMKKITQLLKSPERPRNLTVNKSSSVPLKTYKNTTVNQQTSPKSQKLLAARVISLLKSPKKKKVTKKVEEKEFYPNKVKRKLVNKKVTLKPKHELTKLLSLNKRKWTTPRKGISSPAPTLTVPPMAPTLHPSPPPEPAPVEPPILSFSELVKTCDDINGMTDEDLIEILTCPSPVWWEDPPDWSYNEDPIPKSLLGKLPSDLRKSSSKILQTPSIIEDAISTEQRIPVAKESTGFGNTSTDSQKNMSVDEKLSSIDVSIELTKKDDRFITKRSTLENILSSIKTKSSSDKSPPQIPNSAKVSKITNGDGKFDAIDKVLKENSGLLQISLKKHKPSILKTEPLSRKEEIIDVTSDSTTQESNEDIFAGIREDEILNDLENLEIPIETNNDDRKRKSTLIEADECIVMYDGENASSSFIDKSQVEPEESLETILIEGSDELTLSERYKVFVAPRSTKTTIWSRREERLKNKQQDSANEAKTVPEDLPPLWRYSKVTETKTASPGNSKFESGESDFENSSVISGQDVDTISDTNVKYLNDDQISDYEGEKLKSKAEADSRRNIEDKQEESPLDSKEKEDIRLNEVKSENSETDRTESRNESSEQKSDVASQPEEFEYKKDCIIVYKIIETVSESNEDQKDEPGLTNKPKRIIKLKIPTSSSRVKKTSPKVRASNTHEQTTFNKINDFFKKCKTGYLKTDNVKKIYCGVQKLNKTVNRRGKVVGITKKVFVGDCTNNQVTDDKKSIAVTDSKTVNYCLKCSSIFDTNVCNYCVKNT